MSSELIGTSTSIFLPIGILILVAAVVKIAWLQQHGESLVSGVKMLIASVAVMLLPSIAGMALTTVTGVVDRIPIDTDASQSSSVVPALALEPDESFSLEAESGIGTSETEDHSSRIQIDSSYPALILLWILAVPGGVALLAVAGATTQKGLARARAGRRARELEVEMEAEKAGELGDAWNKVTELHDSLLREYLAKEMDWDYLFSYPAFFDVTDPFTGALVDAIHEADTVSKEQPNTFNDPEKVWQYAYPQAVLTFQKALRKANTNAKKKRMGGISREERKRVNRVKQLIMLAEGSTTESERSLAYARVRKEIKQLQEVFVPDRAIEVLEQGKAQALTR